MANPPLVEIWRDGLMESVHRGAYVVMDASGRVLASAGDIDAPFFPRSACKTLQALPLIETGAADAFGLGEPELAIACASHIAARFHVTTVEAWLRKIGISVRVLECGAQMPRDETERVRLARLGKTPSAIHNNCSGKHAGFVSVARHLGVDPTGYTKPDHPVQRLVLEAMADLCDVDVGSFSIAVDGCSAPNPGFPLRAFGLGVARAAAREGLPPARAQALTWLFASQARFPVLPAGHGKLDTSLMTAARGRLVTKVGAEGVYAGFVLGKGLGVVLKIDDGAVRAAESAFCEILVRLGVIDPTAPAIQPFHQPALRNWRGIVTGQMRPHSDAFSWSLS